jgi:hypothetical protein
LKIGCAAISNQQSTTQGKNKREQGQYTNIIRRFYAYKIKHGMKNLFQGFSDFEQKH